MPSSLRLGALFAAPHVVAAGPHAVAAANKFMVESKQSKKPAVQSLLESAKNMLKNGATPVVVEFAEETTSEVAGSVIPAIIMESESDQNFVNTLHSRFEEVRAALATDNEEVFELNAQETALSIHHKECREIEHNQKCYGGDEGYEQFPGGKRKCEKDLYHLWEIWVEEEETLRGIHGTIFDHFCPPGANGTLHTFRTQSIPWMESYMTQKAVVDAAEVAYDNKVPDCVVTHGNLDTKSAECNGIQAQLELAACAHRTAINEVLQRYYEAYAQALTAYNCAVQEIMELERDRKNEWVTLQVVNCLLDRIREQNGVPCDDSSGGVTEEVAHCEELHGLNVCDPEEGEPRLCLHYPPIPTDPPLCPSRHEVEGVCMPVVQPIPCNADFIAQEYADLPSYPLPPFSEANPGCNAYPACSACPPMPSPQPITIDSCPGYTIDGCIGSDEEVGEHPLTFVRDVEGTADVRCCSIDGDTCASQNFEGGVDFQDPNGNIHPGCYFGVTYQEAMTVCHNAGMRICTSEEMQTCCNTGCWHNEHAIWVNQHEAGMTLEERYAAAEAQAQIQWAQSQAQATAQDPNLM